MRAMVQRKSDILERPRQEIKLQQDQNVVGIKKFDMDFGAFSNLITFSENRVYVARWACGEDVLNGVTVDVLDRETFQLIKRIEVANCDNDYQDGISSIGEVPGYLVLALDYRYDEPRDNVAVVDSRSLELVLKGRIAASPDSLGEWNDQLLRCATKDGEPYTRLDLATARLVPATEQEVLACLNGAVKPVKSVGHIEDSGKRPELVTSKYRIYEESEKYPLRYFRFFQADGSGAQVNSIKRMYVNIHETRDADIFVLRHSINSEQHFVKFDVATQSETTLIAFTPSDPDVASSVWRDFLFIAVGRDLFVYDILKQHFSWYEKDFIREGLEPICTSCNDRNGIRQLLLDGDRLLVLTLDGDNSRTINLPVFIRQFGNADFFDSQATQLDK